MKSTEAQGQEEVMNLVQLSDLVPASPPRDSLKSRDGGRDVGNKKVKRDISRKQLICRMALGHYLPA